MTKDIFSAIRGLKGNVEEKQSRLMMAEARDGKISTVEDYFHAHGTCKHLGTDRVMLIKDMLDKPSSYPRKADLISVILKSVVNTNEIFASIDDRGEKLQKDIWSLYAKSPGEDSAKAGAMLIAEYIRYQYVSADKAYTVPYKNILDEAVSLTNADNRRKMMESILMIQNALVDYVAEQGPKLPLNKGASMLNHVFNEGEEAVLWTRKMTELASQKSYSVREGDLISYRPVFQ